MKKVALVFVLAVFVPSLVLAWLAIRSLQDQQFLIERQQSLLYQGVADALAKSAQDLIANQQQNFTVRVSALLDQGDAQIVARSFDDLLRKDWPVAEVGFAVGLNGEILSPSPLSRPEAQLFCTDNNRFFANRESAEVYWNPKQVGNEKFMVANNPPPETNSELDPKRSYFNKSVLTRNVIPQQQIGAYQKQTQAEDSQHQFSKIAASSCEFRQLIGEAAEGTLARFVDNKLRVLFWFRPPTANGLVFGTQLALPRLVLELRSLFDQVEPALRDEICVALLDDTAKPAAVSRPGFQATWKRPFVATEIGEALPHWEVAVYLLNPAKLTQSAHTLKLTLGSLIGLLVLAIGVGSWLIVADLNRQLTLARQKTDFVSNVSHELKTPLTSIRMFSELIAEGRVNDPERQRNYLGIITAEAARLSRLINNVLDFARLERGEKKYNLQRCDVVALARETADTFRPHFEANGFHFDCTLVDSPVLVNADRDALAQIVVNLLSNAEKYSDHTKEIALRVLTQSSPLPHVEVQVLDRGMGVPSGCEEKIFEQFFRAHDSLSSGIQGSGLGLTLARQIARAHGGDIVYEPRPGGGSCFSLRLPILPS
jgi:signal transduction histidine kinase